MNDEWFEEGSYAMFRWGFLAGLVAGTLIGSGSMLLLAPQSGKRTRSQIQRRSAALREQAAGMVDDSLEQARAKAGQIKDEVSKKIS